MGLAVAIGAGLALVYAVFAAFVVASERKDRPSGHFISLKGMGAFIVTLPVSAPLEMLGMRPDFRRNDHMALAVGGCAVLVFGLGLSVAWVILRVFGIE